MAPRLLHGLSERGWRWTRLTCGHASALLLVLVAVASSMAHALAAAPIEVPGSRDAQDFAMDASQQHLVVQGVVRAASGEEQSFVQRHTLRQGRVSPAHSLVMPEWLGHQGISIESATPEGLRLWASMSGDHGRDAARVFWSSDGTLSAPHIYTLFPPAYFVRDSTMPKVCADGLHLVARGRTAYRKQFVAVFRLADLLRTDPTDAWKQAIHRWPIDDEGIQQGLPLQGLSCGADQVFVLLGGSRSQEPKRLTAYRFDGVRLASHVGPWDIGIYAGLASKFYEPEGLQVLSVSTPQTRPVMGVKVGTGAQRTFLLFTPDP